MLDFNNPYLGAQEKKDLLHYEVSTEYREEKKRMAEAGCPYSSPSYWVLSVREFMELTKASTSLDTLFKGELNENLYHPDYQVLLMEHDRVEAGEWDNFYQRFAPVGYQNVCVIGINGWIEGEVPKSHEDIAGGEYKGHICRPTWEEYGEQLKDYEESAYWSEQGEGFFPIGIWDIPINELNAYESKRVWKRTYYFSSYFELLMGEEMKQLKKNMVKRVLKKAKASNKGFSNKPKKKVKKSKKKGGKK
jgi:hypothetical protein